MSRASQNVRFWFASSALCLSFVALTACGKKKSVAPADSVSIDQPHPPDLQPGKTLLATLERTGCYGECPVYRLTVATDGSVVYVGTRWVKVTGRRDYSISSAQLAELQSAFKRANFMALRDYDHVESTEDDWAHISFRRDGHTKRVRHYHGDPDAPTILTALEDEIDRVTASGRFVGIPVPNAPSPAIAALAPDGARSSASAEAGSPASRPSSSSSPGASAAPDEAPADPDNHP